MLLAYIYFEIRVFLNYEYLTKYLASALLVSFMFLFRDCFPDVSFLNVYKVIFRTLATTGYHEANPIAASGLTACPYPDCIAIFKRTFSFYSFIGKKSLLFSTWVQYLVVKLRIILLERHLWLYNAGVCNCFFTNLINIPWSSTVGCGECL